MVPARQQHIDQAANPGPVGGGPIDILFFRKEIVEEFNSRDMAENDPVGVESAFRRAGRSRCVDDQRGIVRLGHYGLEMRGSLFQRRPEIDDTRPRFSPGDENDFQFGETVTYLKELLDICPIGDDRLGPAVHQAIFKGVGSEKGEQRDRDRPQFVDGDVGNGRFGALWEQNADPVAPCDAVRPQCICQSIGEVFDVPKGKFFSPAPLVFIDESQPIAFIRPFVANIYADVVEFRNVPVKTLVNFIVRAFLLQHEPPPFR